MAASAASQRARLTRLISTLLESARPRPPEFQVQDLHPIIRRAVELLAQRAARRQIRIVTELQAEPSTLSCDGEQLVQVFLNLLLNALQILPEGGEIVVHTVADADRLTIVVADNGPGIPPDIRGRVFDPFFTLRAGGMRLGLCGVHQLTREHGGGVNVREGKEGGGRFSFVFPPTPKPGGP